MDSLQSYFESFIADFAEEDPQQVKRLEVALHAGAMAVCTMLSKADSSEHPHIIKELQQEEHAFGKKEL